MVGFERLGVFPYSQRKEHRLPRWKIELMKKSKSKDVMLSLELRQEISFDFEADCVGEKLLVMIEEDIFQMSMPMSDEPTWMRQALMVTFL